MASPTNSDQELLLDPLKQAHMKIFL